MLKKVFGFVMVLLLLTMGALQVWAYDLSCALTNTTAEQDVLKAKILADVNAARLENNELEFATFDDYLTWAATRSVRDQLERMKKAEADRLVEKAVDHSNETAPNAMCTAIGLDPGCTRGAVACFVLSGNVTCD